MAKLTHYFEEGRCYFITSTTERRKNIFSKNENAQILSNILYNLRKRGKFFLLGFVLMPEHFHLLIVPRNGVKLSWIMQEIKKGSARLINKLNNSQGKIWLDEYYDYVIRDENDLVKHLNYIYTNPVKRGLVETPEEYPWSSANGEFHTDLEDFISGSGTSPTTPL